MFYGLKKDYNKDDTNDDDEDDKERRGKCERQAEKRSTLEVQQTGSAPDQTGRRQ